jgi:hypothetical protein
MCAAAGICRLDGVVPPKEALARHGSGDGTPGPSCKLAHVAAGPLASHIRERSFRRNESGSTKARSMLRSCFINIVARIRRGSAMDEIFDRIRQMYDDFPYPSPQAHGRDLRELVNLLTLFLWRPATISGTGMSSMPAPGRGTA